jgi:hypothetical protein
MKAADGIVTLAEEAESESVQLSVWRAILADQRTVSKFSDLEYRMAEIEEQLSARTRHTRMAATGYIIHVAQYRFTQLPGWTEFHALSANGRTSSGIAGVLLIQ